MAPQYRGILCSVSFDGVKATTGTEGLSFDRSMAANPECVKTTISFAPMLWAAMHAPTAIDSGNLLLVLYSDLSRSGKLTSVFLIIESITLTASTGYFPDAVSPDSITASVPSSIAFATSDASALVGLVCCVIDSSIWVAVITTFPFMLARSISIFWMTGTCSVAISTPRSPLATIIPSTTSMISSMLSRALGFSIFAMIGGRFTLFFLAQSVTLKISSACLTNETAT